MNDTALTVVSPGGALASAAWTRDQLDLIKRTCCPPSDRFGEIPDEAFEVFLHVCKANQLDPLLRECWTVPRQNYGQAVQWQPMVARDGYLTAAHRSGVFAGMKTEVLPPIPTDADPRSTHWPIAARCTVWRRDWKEPVTVEVAFKEYYAEKSPLWKRKPRTMIAKVAEAHALRRAFSLHGTFIAEEFDRFDAGDAAAKPDALPHPLKLQEGDKDLPTFAAYLHAKDLYRDACREYRRGDMDPSAFAKVTDRLRAATEAFKDDQRADRDAAKAAEPTPDDDDDMVAEYDDGHPPAWEAPAAGDEDAEPILTPPGDGQDDIPF